MLCYGGQLGNGSVATHFILISRTVASSATGSYVVVLEQLGRKEEPTSGIEEQTRTFLVPMEKRFRQIIFDCLSIVKSNGRFTI